MPDANGTLCKQSLFSEVFLGRYLLSWNHLTSMRYFIFGWIRLRVWKSLKKRLIATTARQSLYFLQQRIFPFSWYSGLPIVEISWWSKSPKHRNPRGPRSCLVTNWVTTERHLPPPEELCFCYAIPKNEGPDNLGGLKPQDTAWQSQKIPRRSYLQLVIR